MTAKPTSRDQVTAAEAQARGLVPTGHVWSEERQEPEPRGLAIERAILERPIDLQKNLTVWRANRETLVRFVREYLAEAEYTEKGYPVPGKMHDFYTLPGYPKKELTKQGAEKIAQLFNLRRASTETVERQAEKGYAMAVVRVRLVDQYRREAGSGEGACSTAEAGFRSEKTLKKYGGDYRAALNDIIARADKRAFVRAVIYAIAGDELFDASAAQDDEDVQRDRTPPAPPPSAPRMPTKIKQPEFRDLAGQPLADIDLERLSGVANWLRTKADPQRAAGLLRAIDDELERRTAGDDDSQDDLL